MTVKFASALPGELGQNGLLGIDLDELAVGGDRLVIARCRPKKRVDALDGSKDTEVHLEVVAVEVMGNAYKDVAADLMEKVKGERTGHVGLPLLPRFFVECPACGGSGEVKDLFSDPDAGGSLDEAEWDRACLRCSGTGEVEVAWESVAEQTIWLLAGGRSLVDGEAVAAA